MNTNTFPAKSRMQHQKMPDVSIPQPRYYTASEFRRFCKDDLTRLLKNMVEFIEQARNISGLIQQLTNDGY